MNGADWLTVIASFFGAGLGAGLSYVAAQKATGQREGQGRREEWGRRFTAALGYFAERDARARELGRVMLTRLAQSELAGAEERTLADDLLSAEARHGIGGRDVATLAAGTSLDQLIFVEEDGHEEDGHEDPPGGSREDHQEAAVSKKTIKVTRDQVSAARALIQLRGGVDKVGPLVARIAEAKPSPRQPTIGAPS